MTIKHTPGPWQLTDDHPNRSCLRVKAGPYRDVADLYDAPDDTSHQDIDGIWRDDPQRIANGYLIAAAPDLYDALCDMVSDHEAISAGTLAFAKRALAKARGETE